MDALRIVVGSLVLGASAAAVEAFAEAVGPLAAVGFAEQVERHQVEQLGVARAVGERPDAVADPAVDLAQDLLGRAGRVDAVGVACWDLRLGDSGVGVDPVDGEGERPVLAAGVLGATPADAPPARPAAGTQDRIGARRSG